MVILTSISALLIALLAGISLLHWRKYRFIPPPATPSEPPSVSLLIPARNETHAVTRALTNVLALEYPKLEIIVLDDNSNDNTSEKIRSFAHDGIRFIQGEPIPEGWIGKNWACHQLSQAASGEYLIFCDMDVRLAPAALGQLIRSLHARSCAGGSVMPRWIPERMWQAGLAPLLPWVSYLLSPRLQHIRPAYGGLLIFRADIYRTIEGYQRFRHYSLPEFRLAHEAAKYGEFSFMLASPRLSVTLRKTASGLRRSRRRYLHDVYRMHSGLGALHAFVTLLPLALLLFNLWIYAAYIIVYAMFAKHQMRYWPAAALLHPLVCIHELGLLLHSMHAGQRESRTWRNRPLTTS